MVVAAAAAAVPLCIITQLLHYYMLPVLELEGLLVLQILLSEMQALLPLEKLQKEHQVVLEELVVLAGQLLEVVCSSPALAGVSTSGAAPTDGVAVSGSGVASSSSRNWKDAVVSASSTTAVSSFVFGPQTRRSRLAFGSSAVVGSSPLAIVGIVQSRAAQRSARRRPRELAARR